MDKLYLRQLFESQKGFLQKLQSGEPAQRTLSVANDHSLNVLIRALHLIAIGEIVLRSNDSYVMKTSRKVKHLRLFESKTYLIKLLNDSRENKLKVLRQLSSLYPILLYSFFNEM